jgi:K+-sensing histidine kinase KdpD
MLETMFNEKEIPILFLINEYNKDIELSVLKDGGADIIVKPFTKEILDIKLNKQIKMIEEKEKFLNKINELNNMNQEKDRFLSVLAHDLRNPFFGILGLSELVVKKSHKYDKDKMIEKVNKIYTLSKNIYIQFEKLIQWANLKKIVFNTKCDTIYIKKNVENIVESFSSKIKEKEITLTTDIDNESIIFFDEELFEIVIKNILDNAIKFNQVCCGIIFIKAYLEDANVVLSIKDNGVGMSEKQLDKIYSFKESRISEGTMGEKGIGMGFLIINELIKEDKIKFEIKSNQLHGTEVKVSFESNCIV